MDVYAGFGTDRRADGSVAAEFFSGFETPYLYRRIIPSEDPTSPDTETWFVGGLVTGVSPCILPVLPIVFLTGTQNTHTETPVVSDADTSPTPRHTSRRSTRQLKPYRLVFGLVLSFSIVTLVGTSVLSVLHLPRSALRWTGLVVLSLIGVVAGATGRIGIATVALTVSFTAGVAVPLLVFAFAGSRVAERIGSFRRHQRVIRGTAGVAMVAAGGRLGVRCATAHSAHAARLHRCAAR